MNGQPKQIFEVQNFFVTYDSRFESPIQNQVTGEEVTQLWYMVQFKVMETGKRFLTIGLRLR
jgi:hypothetical protein